MRIVHMSDTHLGWRSLHRVDDAAATSVRAMSTTPFERAIDKAIELAT